MSTAQIYRNIKSGKVEFDESNNEENKIYFGHDDISGFTSIEKARQLLNDLTAVLEALDEMK